MAILRLLNSDWRNYALIALLLSLGFMFVQRQFDKSALRVCAAERAAVVQLHEQFKSSAQKIAERQAAETKKRSKRLDKNIREIGNEASCNVPVSPCLSGVVRMFDAAGDN